MSLQRHIGFVVLQFCLIPALSAETFTERHARDFATNPPDLHFRLGSPNVQRRFHIGERIPITLEFSSSSPDKYKLNGATYDRSGRLPTEEFVLDREDVKDPYQDYFGIGVLGWIGGGLRGYPVLESKPYSINLELNDWFRLDRPGRYRVYLKSHRLTRERLPGEAGEKTIQFAAISNILEIEIMPEDPGWEAAKLTEIGTMLDQPEPERPVPGGGPVPSDPFEEKRALARRELRYLGTNAGIDLMFDRARRKGADLDTFALLAAHDRAHVIARFDSYLSEPEVGFREWDIRVRALFTFLEKDAPKPVPTFAWQIPDPAGWDKIRQTLERRQQRFQDLVHAEAVGLIPLAALKPTAARKTSAEAIARVAPGEARAARLIPPDDYGLTRDQLIAQFDQFPREQQLELLSRKWDLVRGPEMIPLLRRTIEKAEEKPLLENAMALRVWGAEAGITDVALRRLNELSPEEATATVRKDFASGKTRFAGFAVRSLPALDFLGTDDAFALLLKENLSGVLPLVAKFGTVGLAKQMHEIYGSELWPCAEEESFDAYFVRVQPKDLGRDALKRAMADRELRGCYRWLLGHVAQVVWNGAVEEQAIAMLSDPDPEAALSAAEVLSIHGGPAVEPFLWKRLEQWSEKWRGRTEELQTHPITDAAPNRGEEQLGSRCSGRLARPSRGLSMRRGDNGSLHYVSTTCAVRDGRAICSRALCRWTFQMVARCIRLQGYTARTLVDLKTKLEQFPAGTTFRWCPPVSDQFDGYTPGQSQEMFEDLSLFLSAHSMTIEPYSAEKCAPGGGR